MDHINFDLMYYLAKDYHQDLIHQAEMERLIRNADRSRVKHLSFYRRLLCWLGYRLIAWGHSLSKHDETLPVDLAASTLHLSNL